MWGYYQTVEHGRQPWQLTASEHEEALRQGQAYHMSIYFLDKLPETVDASEIRYKGDLWFDIDHKPEGADPSQAETDKALNEAIYDLRRLLSYLESIGLETRYCRLFASGSKGFHVCIPGRLFGAASMYKNLPRIHKLMAQTIEHKAGLLGLDMSTYSSGKGHLLRVENMPRANGKYKVSMTSDEVSLLSPEYYRQITSSPRLETEHTAPKSYICTELVVLFEDAKENFNLLSKLTFNAVSAEQLSCFSDDSQPTCIQWLTQAVNVKEAQGGFNKAKMSLARYVMSAPISDNVREKLIDDFADSWTSSRHKTAEARKNEVKSSLKFGRENGFSCELMTKSFTDSPCSGCPMKLAKQAALSEQVGINETPNGYSRGDALPITNFILKPLHKYVEENSNSHEFMAYDYLVYEAGATEEQAQHNILTLDNRAWLSTAEFRKQLMRRQRLIYTGNDLDLQYLRNYITSPTLVNEVLTMKNVKTVGLYHHLDISRGIDELVWVQPGWSINASGVANSLRYTGKRYENGGYINNLTLDMETIDDKALSDPTIKAYQALLKSNISTVIAPIVGWMAACWLRPHLRMKGSDRHFPVLQIWGQAGIGKTETAALFSVLGGADYVNNGAMAVSASTPYAIREEASVSTTVPRIFDELNEHKISDRHRYTMAIEALKASASGGNMPQGRLSGRGDGGVTIDERPATSPLIVMATQENPAKEIVQRSVSVQIDGAYKDDPSYTDNFELAREAQRDLFPIAKCLMTEAMNTSPLWAWERMAENRKLLPDVDRDRIGKNWQVVLTGIDFLVLALEKAGCPAYVVTQTSLLKDVVLGMLKDERYTSRASRQTEVDMILDKFGEMVGYTDVHNNPRVKFGIHYSRTGTTLHLYCGILFPMYIRYMRELGKVPELSELTQFRNLLQHQKYFLGDSMAPGVRSPKDWFSFSIPELKKRGVVVERFIED
jgi:hypothetical protein